MVCCRDSFGEYKKQVWKGLGGRKTRTYNCFLYHGFVEGNCCKQKGCFESLEIKGSSLEICFASRSCEPNLEPTGTQVGSRLGEVN